jgi:hypothetical protein
VSVRQNAITYWIPDAQNNFVIGPGTGVGHLPTIGDTPNPVLISLDVYVEDNLMQCGSSGINLDTLCYHAREVGISGNVIGPSAVAGVAIAGSGVPAPVSRVQITGNEIGVTSAAIPTGDPAGGGSVTAGNGIVCGVSAARISDNDVVSQGASGGGILLTAPLFPMLIDGCQILGNRINGVSGIGIEIQAPLASAIIKQNMIQGAGGGGIVTTGKGSAQHLSIANNQLLGLIPVIGQLQSALGIRLNLVSALEIEGNIIRDLGMDVASNVSRVAIALVACSAVRIAGNQISNIGPVNPTFAPAAPSAAIAVTGATLDRAEVSGNIVRRSDPIALGAATFTLWRALYIGPLVQFAAVFTHKFVKTAAGQFFFVGAKILAGVTPGAQLAAVRGNVMEAASAGPFAPAGSLVEVDVTGSAIFSDNQCVLLSAGNPSPLATLTAPMIAAANNILTGGAPTLQIAVPPDKFTALGNVTTTPISVNGPPVTGVWAPLNVHA